MAEFWHILYRNFVFHLPWAIIVQKMAYHGLRYAQRKVRGSNEARFIGDRPGPIIILSALVPVLLTFWREPGDVSAGGTVIKSIVDSAFWLLCGLIGAFETYRVKYKD